MTTSSPRDRRADRRRLRRALQDLDRDRHAVLDHFLGWLAAEGRVVEAVVLERSHTNLRVLKITFTGCASALLMAVSPGTLVELAQLPVPTLLTVARSRHARGIWTIDLAAPDRTVRLAGTELVVLEEPHRATYDDEVV